MPIDPKKRCRCHGEPMYYCKNGERQRAYHCMTKRRALMKRQNAQPNRRAARVKYNQACQLKIGGRYIGYCSSPETAAVIRLHIKERLRVAKQGFKNRAKTESVTAGTIPTQTSNRKD